MHKKFPHLCLINENEIMMKYFSISIALLILIIASCGQPAENVESTDSAGDYQKELQEQLINAQPGDTIHIPAGTFEFTRSISLDGVANVTIKGAGKDKTILSFKNQIEGAEGIKVVADAISIEDLTVQDTKGDAIKVQDSKGVTFRNLRVTWTNGPDSKNGAYGLYPVSCDDVLIEGCEASCASDAGIYVGQSINVIIRNNTATKNVAGIEIENCVGADVYNNKSYGNTGGVFIFDLPELPRKNGHHIRVFNNEIIDNNLDNFSPEGNTVALVPAGTGVLVMSTRDVEVFENEISNHKTVSITIVSYLITQKPFEDTLYNPFSSAIYIHDNKFIQAPAMPDTSRDMGKLVALLFQGNTPEIVYDGTVDPRVLLEDGSIDPSKRICLQNNGDIRFANINAPGDFKDIDTDMENYNCELSTLSPIEL